MPKLTLARSIAAEGCYFLLDQKVTKKSNQQRGFFSLRAFALQSGQNHGLQILPPLRSLIAIASGKYCYAFAMHKATTVLPAFVRSFFADNQKKIPQTEPHRTNAT
ncbi:hypothetical protein CKK33_00375 [Mucilaginibacter sp. MD40]|uniref:hypothetical protein n=1 Tax=Mucilaginibacter sp. MD40 TaxID=2029590 RepID=UPI000BACDCA9|nr:hypothetical protein [Mucilaginibacter sp. MD40]PAW92030.1 hypothetical protein CKK33_00375 [Mucilaginibacter sp. MD40]